MGCAPFTVFMHESVRNTIRIRTKFFLYFFVILFACFFAVRSARAQSPGLTVSPVKSFMRLMRGEDRRGVFEVVNRSRAPLPLDVRAQFFGVQDELGTIVFHDAQGIATEENPEAWVKLKQPFLLLGPLEARPVSYALTVPDDAPLGTYTIAAIFQSKFPREKISSPSAQLLPAIGSLFFIDVVPRAGEEISQTGAVEIEHFGIPPQELVKFRPFGASIAQALNLDYIGFSFVEKSPLTFTARILNESRYIARPTGVIAVRGPFGRTIGEAFLPEGAILPGTARRYSITFEKSMQGGIADFLPDAVQKSFLPGRYTAQLTLVPNAPYASAPNPFTFTFWAFPRILMLSTGLFIVLGLFVIRFKRRILAALKIFLWQKS